MAIILLCDNGSSKPQATLQLRYLAAQLSQKLDKTIYPVSLQHANKIPTEDLDNIPAMTFRPFLQEMLNLGENEFIVLPMFFGHSKAISKFIPDVVEELISDGNNLSVKVADVIYPLPDGEQQLASILAEHINQNFYEDIDGVQKAVLVDHGSPSPKVTEVRKHIAQSITPMLTKNISLEQAVMERREGKDYDFNGDLLENWLTKQAEKGETAVIIALMFFLPGRHAGVNGDIDMISHSVLSKYPDFRIRMTPLICEHPEFLNILEDRLTAIEK